MRCDRHRRGFNICARSSRIGCDGLSRGARARTSQAQIRCPLGCLRSLRASEHDQRGQWRVRRDRLALGRSHARVAYFVRECLRRARFHRRDESPRKPSRRLRNMAKPAMAVAAVKAQRRQSGFIAAHLVLGCNSIFRLHRRALAARRCLQDAAACIAFKASDNSHVGCTSRWSTQPSLKPCDDGQHCSSTLAAGQDLLIARETASTEHCLFECMWWRRR